MKKTLAIILSAVMVLGMAFTVQADGDAPADGKVYNLSFPIHDPVTSAKTQLYQEMADEVEKATNGGVKITIYPSGTLVAGTDVAEGLLAGEDGSLNPGNNATREQVAAVLHRFCENVLN